MNILKLVIPQLLLLASISSAQASAYDAVYAFGDSLSDNGALHPTNPPSPYDNGRLSNGPVTVEYLANEVAGGNLIDYAVAGAETGLLNPALAGTQYADTGVLSQVDGYQAAVAGADPNALYFIWAGANDLLDALSGNPANPQAALQSAIQTAIGNIVTEVDILESMGARHILVPNLSDLGLTPQIAALGGADVAIANQATESFDYALSVALPANVIQFDTYGLVNAIVNDPSAYGFSDVTDACYNGVNPACTNPDAYLFWDTLHPTTAADQLMAEAAQFAVAEVPEPEIAWLMLSGAGLLTGFFRRRKA
ncbi:MAG: SGNH/GDSL hydrolase family protein [Methylomonas sp.]|jgi:phospholipase/lecithinase/hemolysin